MKDDREVVWYLYIDGEGTIPQLGNEDRISDALFMFGDLEQKPIWWKIRWGIWSLFASVWFFINQKLKIKRYES